jgi:hypothetical protein
VQHFGIARNQKTENPGISEISFILTNKAGYSIISASPNDIIEEKGTEAAGEKPKESSFNSLKAVISRIK